MARLTSKQCRSTSWTRYYLKTIFLHITRKGPFFFSGDFSFLLKVLKTTKNAKSSFCAWGDDVSTHFRTSNTFREKIGNHPHIGKEKLICHLNNLSIDWIQEDTNRSFGWQWQWPSPTPLGVWLFKRKKLEYMKPRLLGNKQEQK